MKERRCSSSNLCGILSHKPWWRSGALVIAHGDEQKLTQNKTPGFLVQGNFLSVRNTKPINNPRENH
jgi:hypothetical protein